MASALLAALVMISACTSDDDSDGQVGGQATALGDAVAPDEETVAGPAASDGDAEEATRTIVVDGQSPPSTASIVEEVGEVLVETGEGLADEDLELYLARRYEAYWQAFDLARRAPTANPETDYPALATLVSGDQLEQTYAELKTLAELGEAIREPDVPAVAGLDVNSAHRIRVESLEPGVAELVSCLVNDQVRYDVATGEVKGQLVVTAQTRTTMARADGTWKVIRSLPVELTEGVSGCWLEPEELYPL
ncbi:MAG: hypothetical protein AAF531_18520 [Actinomycetota bacterium]